MTKKLKEGDVPLFDMDDKQLVSFAYKARNHLIMDTVAPEMMRRMNSSIKSFNESSTKQSKIMITLTKWITGLTIILGAIACFQLYLVLH